MTSLTNSNNHRRTKAKAKNISDDNNMPTANTATTTTTGMKSLKESLSSMILQDAETKEQRQRHNKRGISSGAQKIMDKLASLRSDDVVHQAASCHRNNDNHHHRRRRRPSQLNNDNTNNDKGDQPLPRLIGVHSHNTSSSSSLDTSSYSYSSFASYNNSSSPTTLDASFASSSLDDSLRRLSLPSNNQRLEKDDYNNDKYNRNDNINIMTASTSTNIHNEQKQPPPPPHKKEQQPTTTTITRRKSIPRHRNSELNSSISSCLRHPAKYNTTSTSSSSDRSIDTRRTFNSSMEDFNDSCSSWVASGVVIAESMEVIHMNE